MALSAGSIEIKLFAELARIQSDMKKANKVVEDAMGGIQKTVRATTTVFNRLAGAFSGAALIKIADDYKRFDSQLKLSTKSLNEYSEAYANVIRIGRTAQSDIGAIGVLYARLNNNLRDFNVTQSQVASVTETISLALRTNNATVQETHSVMLQLSQSFGSGKLNGQEFLAVAEGAPMLLRQLANSLKVPFGALKDLSAQGKITREDLLKAWSDPAYIQALRQQVKEVGTVTSAITVLMNNLKQYIGEADKATGATKVLSSGIMLIADNINLLVSGALAYGAVAFVKWTQAQYEALRATQANNAQKVIAAKVELSLAQALYASGGAVTKQTANMANNAAATTLATSNAARLVAAQQSLSSITSTSAVALRGLGTILSAFGGWIGLAITGAVLFADKLVLLYDKVRGLTPEMKKLNDETERRIRLEKAGVDPTSASAEQEASLKREVLLYNEMNAAVERQKSLVQSYTNLGLTKRVTEESKVLADMIARLKDQAKVMGTTGKEANALTPAIESQTEAFDKLSKTLKTAKELADEYAKSQALIIIEGSKLGLSQSEITAKLVLLKEQYEKATGVLKANKNAADVAKEAAEKEAQVRKYLFNLQQELDSEVTKRYNQAVKIRQEDDEAEFKRKSEMMKDLQKQATENYKEAQKVVEEQAKETERINDRLYNNLARSLTDSIVRGFEQGLSFVDNFKQTIKNLFKSFVVNVGVNFVQQGLQAAFGGLTSRLFAGVGGALVSSNAVAGEGSGVGSLLEGLSSLNTNIVGSIEKLGAFLAYGDGGFLGIGDTIGGFMGQYSSQIASGLAFAPAALSLLKGDVKSAAFQGVGAGIGIALGGPVGGAIGSLLGGAVGGLFGSKKSTPRYSSGVNTNYENGNFTATNLSRIAGFNKDAGGREGMTGAAEIFSKSLGSLLNAFGIDSVIKTNLMFFRRKGAWGFGDASVDGVQAGGTGRIYNRNQQAAYDEFINAFLTVGLVNAIKVSKLPEGLKALFDGIADRAQLGNMIQAVMNIGVAQEQLTKQYALTASQAGQVATATGLVGDELIAFVNKLASTASATRTIGETLIATRNALTTQTGLSILPDSLKAFDDVLKSLDKTTQSGIESFAKLFQLREGFAEFTTAIDSLKNGVSNAIFDSMSPAQQQLKRQEDLTKLFNAFDMAVPTTVQELIAIGEAIDYTTIAGIDLAASFPSLVSAFNETKQAVDALVSSLNPNDFRTFFDFAVGSSYARQGLRIPSYDVGTSYVPNDGMAMLHQGEAVLTRTENNDISMNSGRMVSLLESLVARVASLEYDIKRTADGTQRTARELEDITGGDVIIQTQVV